MGSSNLIRKKFLEYFNKHNHQIINSSSLIPDNDPTLLFTNAGMVQFKNILTGVEESRLKKVATSQNMKQLKDEGCNFIMKGITSIEEIIRVL